MALHSPPGAGSAPSALTPPQERWRVSAEQSKAEATQRALEEQRRVVARQTAVEREELERAKVGPAAPRSAAGPATCPGRSPLALTPLSQSALLEEQKVVMRKCGEEQRRLAAEWAEFFAQQKLSKERAEREAERALQADSKREGTLVSLAKEQAELKIRASELRAKEDQLAAEREALERERQELRLEQERVSAAARRIRLRAEEVERMSQVPGGSAQGRGRGSSGTLPPARPADPGGLPAGGLREVRGGGTGLTGGPAGAVRTAGPAAAGAAAAGAPAAAGAAHAPGKAPPRPGSPRPP